MRWTPALALSLLSLVPSARQEGQAPPVITVAGQSFPSWQAYLASPLFRALNLRCATHLDPSALDLRPLSDCSSSSTSILPVYDPTGHEHFRIPVVVHVLLSSSGQGAISDALIQSQVDVLNEDFQAISGSLGENGTNASVEFFLATTDPSGNPTTGITRTVNTSWFNDSGNYYDTLAWDTNRYLNFYTNQASGALGYVPALPQNGIVGANSDRVVVLWSAFGRNAPVGAPFDLGRTATHEVGHYFGLYHTFDGGCSSPTACYTTGDRICDTNPESGPVFGCPTSSNTCGSSDPYHSYMDYSDDDCYMEFTPEQVNRMRCTITNWRPDLPAAAGCVAQAVTRTAGTDVNGYTTSLPVLGSNLTMNIVAPGWTQAILYSYSAPASKIYPNGSVQLFDHLSTRYFQRTISLPPGTFGFHLPANPALCGITAYTQALLLNGGTGFGFTNAVDLTLGF